MSIRDPLSIKDGAITFRHGPPSIGDLRDAIAHALSQQDMSRTQIRDLFNRRARCVDIEDALSEMFRDGEASWWMQRTAGRPRQMWTCHV